MRKHGFSRSRTTPLGLISPRIQNYYLVTRPSRAISGLVRDRFYFLVRLLKRLLMTTQDITLMLTGRTWNNIDLHLTARTTRTKDGHLKKTVLRLKAHKDSLTWEHEEKNSPDFWALLYLCFLRWPKNSNLIETLRLGRSTVVSLKPLKEPVLQDLAVHIPGPTGQVKLPFKLSQGIAPNALLDFWNAPSKRTFIQVENSSHNPNPNPNQAF